MDLPAIGPLQQRINLHIQLSHICCYSSINFCQECIILCPVIDGKDNNYYILRRVLPLRGILWFALNLANWPPECIGEFLSDDFCCHACIPYV